MHILNSYDVTTTDCAALFALMSAFGLMFLVAATDGHSVHGFGMLGTLSSRQRIIALVGANVLFLVAILTCLLLKGVTPIGLAHGANVWWTNRSNNFDVFSMGITIATYWVLSSPLQSLLAIYMIHRDQQKKQRGMTQPYPA